MTVQEKIEETLSRSVCGGWDRGFLESILQQLAKARALSVKQNQTLGKVLARNTPEHQALHENWSSEYYTKYHGAAKVLAAYHTRQSYYRPMAADILAGNVPQRAKFLKMYDNKYSKKVLGQHAADCKYKVGHYLSARASLDSYKHIEFENDPVWATQNKTVLNFKRRGAFVIEICEEIYSAAKGAKRYKLLPVGETTPIIVEERFLKMGVVKK